MKLGHIGKVKKYTEVTPRTQKELRAYRGKGYRQRKKRRRGAIVLRRKKEPWEIFEDQILQLFQNGLKLQDVIGGPRARLGGHQIDAAGGALGTYVVVDCKSTSSPAYSSLRKAIKDFIGEQREISRGIASQFGAKYKTIKFVLALDGIEYSESEESYADRNGIVLWSDAYLEMLAYLVNLIGEGVKYNVLRELGMTNLPIKEGTGRYYKVPAFRFQQDSQTSYSFLMKAGHLLKLAYVSRIEGGAKGAFQRLLARKKLDSVAAFIDGGGVFKNNIVVNLGEAAFSSPQRGKAARRGAGVERGILAIPKQYCSVWLVDGQHRLYGFARCEKKDKQENQLPVIGLHDMAGSEAARTFVEINQNQKPVDPNILWSLSHQISSGDPQSIGLVLRQLCADHRSLFYKKIYVPGLSRRTKRGYKLYLANFAKGITDRRLLDRVRNLRDVRRGRLTEQEALALVLERYLRLLSRIVSRAKQPKWNKHFFLTNNGLNVMLRVLDELLIYYHDEFPIADVKRLINKPLAEYCSMKKDDMNDLRRLTSSEATREQVATEIIETINRYFPDFAAKYLRKHKKALKQEDPEETLRNLENSLRRLVESCLGGLTSKWWHERIPGDVRTRAEVRIAKNDRPWPWLPARDLSPMYYVDFGDYISIITARNNWTDVFQAVFKNKDIVASNLMELNSIRGDVAHHRELSLDQIDELSVYARKFRRAIDAYQEGIQYPEKRAEALETVG